MMLQETIATTNAKPCVALMGEFSAGKSTLANLMLGAHPLPVQVIATCLPPIRMSFGDHPPYRLDTDGEKHDVDLSNLNEIPLDTTQLIQVFRQEDILQNCDLIDMPGISDPNMDPIIWQRVLPSAHAVIWCTHATQAWRQSEAQVWEGVPAALKTRSILLLTRIDKVASDRDKARVLKRVKREAGALFHTCLPISLIDAHAAGDDFEAWQKCGADAFANSFVQIVERIKVELAGGTYVAPTEAEHATATQAEGPKVTPRRVIKNA